MRLVYIAGEWTCIIICPFLLFMASYLELDKTYEYICLGFTLLFILIAVRLRQKGDEALIDETYSMVDFEIDEPIE